MSNKSRGAGKALRAIGWETQVWSGPSADGVQPDDTQRGFVLLDENGLPAMLYAVDAAGRVLPKLSGDDGRLQAHAEANPSTGVFVTLPMPPRGRKVCESHSRERQHGPVAYSEESVVRRPHAEEGDWEHGGQLEPESAVVTYYEAHQRIQQTPPLWGLVEERIFDSGDPHKPNLGPGGHSLELGWLRQQPASLRWNVRYVEGHPFSVSLKDQGTVTGIKGHFTAWTERETSGLPYRALVVGEQWPFNAQREVYRALTRYFYVPAALHEDPERTVLRYFNQRKELLEAGKDVERSAQVQAQLARSGLFPVEAQALADLALLRDASGNAEEAQQLAERSTKRSPDFVPAAAAAAYVVGRHSRCGAAGDRLSALASRAVPEPAELKRIAATLTECGQSKSAWHALRFASDVAFSEYGYPVEEVGHLALQRGQLGLKQGEVREGCAALEKARALLPAERQQIHALMAEAECYRYAQRD